MAITTIHTALMKKGTSTYEKLICIKDYSGFNETQEEVETTTLCDEQRTYIGGLKSNDSKTFTCNYTATDYSTLKALENSEQEYALWFGVDSSGDPDGSEGKFSFKGYLSVGLSDGDVGSVREMTITIIPSTAITFEAQ